MWTSCPDPVATMLSLYTAKFQPDPRPETARVREEVVASTLVEITTLCRQDEPVPTPFRAQRPSLRFPNVYRSSSSLRLTQPVGRTSLPRALLYLRNREIQGHVSFSHVTPFLNLNQVFDWDNINLTIHCMMSM